MGAGVFGLHALLSPRKFLLSHAKFDLARFMTAAHPTARTAGGYAPETSALQTAEPTPAGAEMAMNA